MTDTRHQDLAGCEIDDLGNPVFSRANDRSRYACVGGRACDLEFADKRLQEVLRCGVDPTFDDPIGREPPQRNDQGERKHREPEGTEGEAHPQMGEPGHVPSPARRYPTPRIVSMRSFPSLERRYPM